MKRRSDAERMAAQTAAMRPCPKCGAPVCLLPDQDGGLYETRSYSVNCTKKCGRLMENLPSNADGRSASVVREWNRLMRPSQGRNS